GVRPPAAQRAGGRAGRMRGDDMTSTSRPTHDAQNGAGALLELKGISKRFGPVRALTSVDLSILPGKVTALCGDNGAGKSVTIKTISGLWTADGEELVWQ